MTREDYGRYVVSHYDSLLRFVRGRGLSVPDAEDVLQQTLLKLLLVCHDIEPDRPDGFVFTALRHAVVDHWRRRGRRPAVPLPDHLPAPDLPDATVYAGDGAACRPLFAEAAAGLTPRERRACAACWRHHGDRAAALNDLGLADAGPRDCYRVYDGPLHHARRKLALALQPHGPALADVSYARLWGLLNEVLQG